MPDHAVEVLDDEWRLVSAAVQARSPFHAVVRGATCGGHYRARDAHLPVSQSEYFWVPQSRHGRKPGPPESDDRAGWPPLAPAAPRRS